MSAEKNVSEAQELLMIFAGFLVLVAIIVAGGIWWAKLEADSYHAQWCAQQSILNDACKERLKGEG